MRRFISIALVAATLLSIALFITSCAPKNMKFGEYKYVYEFKETISDVVTEERAEFAFRRNGTGVYRYYFLTQNGGKELKIDGVVYFEWDEASNGEVFLSETGSEYYSYSKDGETIELPLAGISFGDGFLSYTQDGETYRYMLQK